MWRYENVLVPFLSQTRSGPLNSITVRLDNSVVYFEKNKRIIYDEAAMIDDLMEKVNAKIRENQFTIFELSNEFSDVSRSVYDIVTEK